VLEQQCRLFISLKIVHRKKYDHKKI